MLDAGAFQIFFYITFNESYCSPTTANNSGSYASDGNHNCTNHGLIDGVGRLVREDTGGQTRHHFLHALLVTQVQHIVVDQSVDTLKQLEDVHCISGIHLQTKMLHQWHTLTNKNTPSRAHTYKQKYCINSIHLQTKTQQHCTSKLSENNPAAGHSRQLTELV